MPVRSPRKLCRCGAPKNDAGACPYFCPAPTGARYHRAQGVKPDTSTAGDIGRAVDAAARRIGVPSMTWGSISAKAAAESRARRRTR